MTTHAPARAGKRTVRQVPKGWEKESLPGACPEGAPQGPPPEALVPQAGSSDSPWSGDSAATRRSLAERASHKKSTAPELKKKALLIEQLASC